MSSPTERLTRWAWLGGVRYDEAAKLQVRLREALRRGEVSEWLLLLEHPHVYTLGRNAADGDVTAETGWLKERGVEIHETDRGGQVTYHGPGQLVGYPILNLSPDREDVRRYVRDLQEVLIRTLRDFGVVGERRDGQAYIGVWQGEQKIASIGVHLSRWLTTHGFALNVSTDLGFFSGIVPCGLHGVKMASVESLTGEIPSHDELLGAVVGHFGDVFGRQMKEASPGEALDG